MDLLSLHFARHALAQQAVTNAALLPALAATDAEIAAAPIPADTDHGALVGALYGIPRSSHWATVEKRFREANSVCARCGATTGLQVHHWWDFHEVIAVGRPDLELDPWNLRCLCQMPPDNMCHLYIGHFDDFESFNENLDADIITFRGLTAAQIKADPRWQAERAAKPGRLITWTKMQLVEFRQHLDIIRPPDPKILREFGLEVKPYSDV